MVYSRSDKRLVEQYNPCPMQRPACLGQLGQHMVSVLIPQSHRRCVVFQHLVRTNSASIRTGEDQLN